MKRIDLLLYAVAITGVVLGGAQVAAAGGTDGCVTYFGQNPGGGAPAYLCVASECTVPNDACAPGTGSVGIECGCGLPTQAPCVIEVTWTQGQGYSLTCHNNNCAVPCPNPTQTTVGGMIAWYCACP